MPRQRRRVRPEAGASIAAAAVLVSLFAAAELQAEPARPGGTASGEAEIAVTLSPARLPTTAATRPGARQPAIPGPVQVRAYAWPSEARSEALLSARDVVDAEPTPLPGTATLRLLPGRWIVAVETPTYWAPPLVLQAEAGQRYSLNLDVYSSGVLRGAIAAPRGVTLPAELEVTFEPSRNAVPPVGGDRGTGGKTLCPIEDGATWACRLPQGALDLRISIAGFADTFLWGVVVGEASTTVDRLRLHEGSSVFGWVLSESSEAVEGATAELLPPDAPTAAPHGAQLHGRRVVSDSRGFFHFVGIPPGAYRLRAVRGKATSAEPTITVEQGQSEILGEPLVLFEPMTLEVYADPPVAPNGRPWRVDLRAGWKRSLVGQIEDLALAESGYVAVSGLAPGVYGAELQDADGSGWWAGRLEVAAGMPPLFISVETVEVEGRVRFREEPVAAAEVTMTARGKGEIRFTCDEDGMFAGALPGPGQYDLMVRHDQPLIRYARPRIEVAEEPDFLDVEIPSARIAGSVVDREGKVQSSFVLTVAAGEAFIQDVFEGGLFELWVAPGTVRISAMALGTDRPLSSDELDFVIDADQDVVDLQLVVSPKLELAGRVIGPTGVGVPGATLTIDWEGRPFAPLLVTDGEGRFESVLSEQAESLRVSAVAPGFACRLLSIPARAAGDLILPLSAEAGALAVELPPEPSSSSVLLFPHVIHGGAADPFFLRSCAAVSGGSVEQQLIRAPAVEPGSYEVCLAPYPALWHLARGMRSPDWPCASGHLPAGGELTLSPR